MFYENNPYTVGQVSVLARNINSGWDFANVTISIDEKECLTTPNVLTGDAVWMNFDCTGMVGRKIRFSKPDSLNSLTHSAQ